MNRADVLKLFLIMNNAYPNFTVDDTKVLAWMEFLGDTPFEQAKDNLISHIRTSRYLPTVADLTKPLEPEPEQLALYHAGLRESAQQFLEQLDEWQATAVGPPEEIKAMMRLPIEERTEALREYARRNRAR
ncbi:replicative helicase loader/inhibitor [Paenibacillus rigui]|uniref:Uncharacterized protein n=1 Tax=Paenibacillus rigui TaxID=554312 RepID=A0A229UNW4_9BACL|nr:replicative helicase loader/inhibitor [Paenibacillus rigui]OXM84589.1 hypothetical protein CF651_18955 [Paenibacillus rigui]